MVATELEATLVHSFQYKVAKHVLSLHQILSAQKLLTRDSVHLPIEVMHKNMGLGVSTTLLAPRQHASSEDRRHPPRSIRPVPVGMEI